jgi:hypothetical protein
MARSFAQVRTVFGEPLHTLPAHRATLADLAVDYAACLALVLKCCALTGRAEQGMATDHELALLRGLTPLTKLSTARWAVEDSAEMMEALGGVGYCEDSGMPALVRDVHVMPIWEGTTNVLSLDLLRAEHRSGAIGAVLADAEETAERVLGQAAVAEPAARVKEAVTNARESVARAMEDPAIAQAWARSLAMTLARTYACAALCEQGAWAAQRDALATAGAARRLAERGLIGVGPPDLDLAFA